MEDGVEQGKVSRHEFICPNCGEMIVVEISLSEYTTPPVLLWMTLEKKEG